MVTGALKETQRRRKEDGGDIDDTPPTITFLYQICNEDLQRAMLQQRHIHTDRSDRRRRWHCGKPRYPKWRRQGFGNGVGKLFQIFQADIENCSHQDSIVCENTVVIEAEDPSGNQAEKTCWFEYVKLFIPRLLSIRYSAGTTEARLQEIHAGLGAEVVTNDPSLLRQEVRLPVVGTEDEGVEYYLAIPEITNASKVPTACQDW